MSNLAGAYGQILDEKISEGLLNDSTAKALLSKISVSGYKSGYAYLVNKEGTMMYHPTSSKIGGKVENAVVTGLVAQIKKGIIPKPDLITYVFNGAEKYAAYYVCSDLSILVVTLDQSDIQTTVNEFVLQVTVVGVGVGLLSIAFGIFVGLNTAKPFHRLGEDAKQLAALDLSEDEQIAKLADRNDECGNIARAFMALRERLIEIPTTIGEITDTVEGSATETKDNASNISAEMGDTSDAVNRIVAGMEEVSATISTVNSNVSQITDRSSEVSELAGQGINRTKEIKARAEELRDFSENASKKTLTVYSNVKKNADDAIEKSQAVHKIQELADAITKIASQTNLLSLNASIEAARAGEAGRGFAVVADQIGTLSAQSADATAGITQIASEIENAVSMMSDCLREAISFLEENVQSDYDRFRDVGEKYLEDASEIMNEMSDINSSVGALNEAITSISESMKGIAGAVDETVEAESEIATKTGTVSEDAASMADSAAATLQKIEDLRNIVKSFSVG